MVWSGSLGRDCSPDRTKLPDVSWDKELVDAMTMRMVQKPQSIDTVIGTDLHIDTISDLAAALAGSIGIAASANLDHLI